MAIDARSEAAPSRCAIRRRRKKNRLTLFLALAAVLAVFGAKIANYAWPEAVRLPSLARWGSTAMAGARDWYDTRPWLHSAPPGQRMVIVPGGFVFTSGPDHTPWTHIFNTYPLRPRGSKPAVYASITQGSVAAADDWLRGRVDVPRYLPAQIDGADMWSANPYKERYWRFYYYSLRPTVNLLAAYEATHDRRYVDALLTTNRSFFSGESSSPYAWRDYHSVAFRAIVLAYEWWELRRLHVLSTADSTAFLKQLAKTGDFLMDPNHYQPHMNHGTNQSAALFQLGVDFPDLPHAASWLTTARTRLAQCLDLLIDRDGVLIENSPYYHFYELDKFWQIYQFSQARKVPISPKLASRLRDMTNYATYVLQPNAQMPLLGASLGQTIHRHGSFAEIARSNPAFEYVLTQGRSGTPPPHTSIFFRSAGQTMFRSGWGEGSDFLDAAYLTFNVGAYRSLHSHLDALGFTLYDNGATLLPDAGLYTYGRGPMFDYFHGTASHNTVVVDGRSQSEGSASAGPLVSQNGVTYQSAFSALYEGVSQRRTLMMLNKDHFLVIDRLSSVREHTYEQMFHLFPGAVLKREGLTVIGQGGTSERSVTIRQLDSPGITLSTAIGQEDPPAGLYSDRYNVCQPSYAISYARRGLTAAYTTLISVGPPDPGFSISYDKTRERLVMHDHGRVLRIDLGETPGSAGQARATDPDPPDYKTRVVPGVAPWSRWTAAGDGVSSVTTASDGSSNGALRLSTAGGTQQATNDTVRVDLSSSNLHVGLRVGNRVRLESFSLELSNHRWSSSRRIDLRPSISSGDNGVWMTISLGRDSSLSGLKGHWQTEGGAFDWRHVDGVRLKMGAAPGSGPPPWVEIDSIRSVQQQRRGAVVFVFDDGYESIKPAARYLHLNEMPGNVSVIGQQVKLATARYLNVYDLRMLQNVWGWNMVNHTQQHREIMKDYYDSRRFASFEQDIVDGAMTLEQAGLNSAPNWFIYPHGSTNNALNEVVGRFYKFARTTWSGPEAYPYGSPLRVKTLELHLAVGSGAARKPGTRPSEVIAAIRDAERYHTPLILTFHRIHAVPSDRPGYPLDDFKKIVDEVRNVGIPVLTLSQLDARNGVPVDNRIVETPAIPPLLTVTIMDRSEQNQGFWSRVWDML